MGGDGVYQPSHPRTAADGVCRRFLVSLDFPVAFPLLPLLLKLFLNLFSSRRRVRS